MNGNPPPLPPASPDDDRAASPGPEGDRAASPGAAAKGDRAASPVTAEGDGATTLVATAEDDGRRLDVVLAARVATSRARVQRGISDGDVTVNGRPTRASYRVRAGDLIELDLPEPPAAAELVPEALP